MKRLFALLFAIIFALSLIGCAQGAGSGAEGSGTSGGQADDVTIGILLGDSSSQTMQTMVSHMKERCAELGIECNDQWYGSDVSQMISSIENFITMGIDGLIIQVASEADAVDALNAAIDAGIVVTTYDTLATQIDYDYAFTADDEELGYAIGKMAADWCNENLVANGKDVVVGICNYPTIEFMLNRGNGIEKGITENCPEAQIVITAQAGLVDQGVEAGENFLAAYPDINCVCGINDNSIQGVYEAFQAAGLGDRDDIGLFSCDGTGESLYMISQDSIYKGSIDLNLNMVGVQMIDYTYNKIAGNDVSGQEKINYYPMNEVKLDNVSDYADRYADISID